MNSLLNGPNANAKITGNPFDSLSIASIPYLRFQFQGGVRLHRYLRMLLVVGALSVIRRAKQTGCARRPWLGELLQRRSTKIAAIALANKNARTAWAMMAHGTFYEEPALRAA